MSACESLCAHVCESIEKGAALSGPETKELDSVRGRERVEHDTVNEKDNQGRLRRAQLRMCTETVEIIAEKMGETEAETNKR